MKTILVPTDFGVSARNAMQYAISLAPAMDARIILYHTHHLPVPVSEMPVVYNFPPDMDGQARDQLNNCIRELKQGRGQQTDIQAITTSGFAVDEIVEIAEERNVDLIVMGVSNSSKTGHLLFGSVTTGVMEQSSRPLIVVPEKASYHKPEKISLACDYGHEFSPLVTAHIKNWVKTFGARLLIINVEAPEEKIATPKAITSKQLEAELQEVQHSIHFPAHPDVVKGLVEFDDAHAVDLLVMVPRRHSFLDKIFHTSKTRKMVFETHIPVLILHE
jgi:nucleotide-binding universal stress UspA family protein